MRARGPLSRRRFSILTSAWSEHQMFPEGTVLLPASVSWRPRLSWLGSGKMLITQSFAKQSALLASMGGPYSELTFLGYAWRRLSTVWSWRLCFRFVGVHSLQGRRLFRVGRRGPSVLQKTLGTFTKGLWDWSIRIQGHQSAQGAPSLGFPSLRVLCGFLPPECVIINHFLVSSF